MSVQSLAGRLLLAALLASAVVSIAAGPTTAPPLVNLDPFAEDQAKSVVAEVEFLGQNEVRVLSAEVVYGISHSLFGGPPMYRVSLRDPAGALINEFDIWDPQLVHVRNAQGRDAQVQLASAVSSIIFPYRPRLKLLEITDLRLSPPQVVARADLEPAIRRFCRQNPSEGGCFEIMETPDLVVSVEGPRTAQPGQDIGPELRVVVSNVGTATAFPIATEGEEPPPFLVDVVLSENEALPVALAEFSPEFHDDVLLGGGRASIAEPLEPGQEIAVEVNAVIPEAIPGVYCLGVVVDPANAVPEPNERNNTACYPILIGLDGTTASPRDGG